MEELHFTRRLPNIIPHSRGQPTGGSRPFRDSDERLSVAAPAMCVAFYEASLCERGETSRASQHRTNRR